MRLLKSSQKVTKTGAEAVRGVTENLWMCDNGTVLSCLHATCSPTMFLHISFKYFGRFFNFFSYCIQHCFICRPSDSAVPTNAGIESSARIYRPAFS
jgi:hypothetical protein